MQPIRPLLDNPRQILISPEGQLTLIPFEALKDEQGEFLIQPDRQNNNLSITFLRRVY